MIYRPIFECLDWAFMGSEVRAIRVLLLGIGVAVLVAVATGAWRMRALRRAVKAPKLTREEAWRLNPPWVDPAYQEPKFWRMAGNDILAANPFRVIEAAGPPMPLSAVFRTHRSYQPSTEELMQEAIYAACGEPTDVVLYV